ncbi:hypothetical protein ESCO_006386 [Escovopsis weberi]|uniref:Malate dehydrogenase n=1 Tax=Escovopsis weberi TaxID=150374 RepID=A0A0M8N0J0_ESCWE|nr:hypothetical protein ESCO_006386 [Escovopsis weberi]
MGIIARVLTIRHVAVGRGTQNYTCDASNPTAAPQPIGAMATLFNVSCVAAMWPTLVEAMPLMAVAMDLSTTKTAGAGFAPMSGVHYFTDLTTPYFDLDTPSMAIGEAPCAKNSSTAAPGLPLGGMGHWKGSAVPWLKLTTKDGATGNIKEVYRVNTVGGTPPSSCEGQPASVEVQYSALYWFWESNEE